MDHTSQQPDLDRLFKSARQAHEKGDLHKALELYTAIGRQDPYYPELDSYVRALEVQMTRGFSPSYQRRPSEPHRQPHRATSTLHSNRSSSRYVNPYLLYGVIAFSPTIILTLIMVFILLPDWNWLFSWLVANNLVTFFVYGYDKAISPSSIVRVPEAILLLQVLSGAFVGALLARLIFRHKTRKLRFRVYFWIAEIVSIAWVVSYYLFIWQLPRMESL